MNITRKDLLAFTNNWSNWDKEEFILFLAALQTEYSKSSNEEIRLLSYLHSVPNNVYVTHTKGIIFILIKDSKTGSIYTAYCLGVEFFAKLVSTRINMLSRRTGENKAKIVTVFFLSELINELLDTSTRDRVKVKAEQS